MASLYEDLAAEDGDASKDVETNNKPAEEGSNDKDKPKDETKEQEADKTTQGGGADVNGQDPASKPVEEEKPPLVFVGGLAWSTTEAGLRMYFETFGEVKHIDFKRGFAFVHYATKEAVDACCQAGGEQLIDGKMVEVKISEPHNAPRSSFNSNRNAAAAYGNAPSNTDSIPSGNDAAANSDDPNARSDAPGVNVGRKVFVGGLAQEVREPELRQMMSHHGAIEDVVVMIDRYTGRSRGFGFVTFSSREEAENASKTRRQMLGGKSCEVKLYEPGAKGNYYQNRAAPGGESSGPPQGGGGRGYQHHQTNDWNRHRPFQSGGRGGGYSSTPPYAGATPAQAAGGGYGQQAGGYYGASGGGGGAGYYGQQGGAPYDYQQQQWGGQYDYSAWGGAAGGGGGYGQQQQYYGSQQPPQGGGSGRGGGSYPPQQQYNPRGQYDSQRRS